ncbi:MAG: hypothetical protein HY903_11020 [Deltaproteobacteria bacterium]|nr:hypothetical protein [Deltaproteobacteria bacterium]
MRRLTIPWSGVLAAVGLGLTACGALPADGLDGPVLATEALRPDNPARESFGFDPGDTVEILDSPGGDFRVHYARAGRCAVPDTDLDGNLMPDYVEDTAAVYDDVLTFYRDALGFRAPLADDGIGDNGGDGRFDVYLVDFGGNSDGMLGVDGCLNANPDQCVGYMLQENDFARSQDYRYSSLHVATQILASHEFFHAVQNAYDGYQGSILSEGTATWASEAYNAALPDFEKAIQAYMDNPDQPIDTPMPGMSFNYSTAIFFEFLAERLGQDAVRKIYEASENGANGVSDPSWFAALPDVISSYGQGAFDRIFVDFATWNLFTGNRGDPAQSYALGRSYPRVRLDVVSPPYVDALVRIPHAATKYFSVVPSGRTEMTAALVGPPEELADLHLRLTVERGPAFETPLAVQDLQAGTEVVSTDLARTFIVFLVNTSTGGTSRRPGLCIGTPAEVTACKAQLNPTPPPPPTEEDPGGCLSATPTGPLAVVSSVALLWRRRRGRRQS